MLMHSAENLSLVKICSFAFSVWLESQYLIFIWFIINLLSNKHVITRRVLCKFNGITVNLDKTQHGIYVKIWTFI